MCDIDARSGNATRHIPASPRIAPHLPTSLRLAQCRSSVATRRRVASPPVLKISFVMTNRPYREKLIDEVKKYPVLYDTRNEGHRDIDARDRCWHEISTKLGINSEILKREWKILRDSMRQALKRSKSSTTPAGLPCRKWRFESRMAFLLPYMTKRNQRQIREAIKLDESAEPEQSEQEETDVWDPGNAANPGDNDSLDLFFASVCQSTKRLPRALQNQVKRQVLDVLLRAEDEYHGEDSKDLTKSYT